MRKSQVSAFLLGILTLLLALEIPAQSPAVSATAPVIIDGRLLFQVRGLTAYPASQRAADIRRRIVSFAASSTPITAVSVAHSERVDEVLAGNQLMMSVTDADAALERIDRALLAAAYARRIDAAIRDYRRERSSEQMGRATLLGIAATLAFIAVLWVIFYGTRRLRAFTEDHYKAKLKSIAVQSFEILQARKIWSTVVGALWTMRYIAIALASYLYLQYVLSLFPQTRDVADTLLTGLMQPLEIMGNAILHTAPDLLFLAVLFLVTRYVLRVIRLFFEAVSRGTVRLGNFDPEWAGPTYRLIRLGLLVCVIVVAYPYIPGSESQAFKGLSIFLGIVFSIGSSSVVSNFIAGYSLTYRRAFKVGDWIKVQDILGRVTHSSLQVTHLCSFKNEEVIVPNSVLLNSQVVNYSALAHQQGLILHTTVGIGYETSWRQVEAMLLIAAERTADIASEPKPFVRLTELSTFSANYELNVYCHEAGVMRGIYSELHRHILDVFNEYGVQIMTPAYECDPEQPKIVPREQWFAAPARPNPSPTVAEVAQKTT